MLGGFNFSVPSPAIEQPVYMNPKCHSLYESHKKVLIVQNVVRMSDVCSVKLYRLHL